jgi:hypothetical protein
MKGLLVIGLAIGTLQPGVPGRSQIVGWADDASVGAVTTEVADARGYRHCHNTPRRIYCHTREHLPITLRIHSNARV